MVITALGSHERSVKSPDVQSAIWYDTGLQYHQFLQTMEALESTCIVPRELNHRLPHLCFSSFPLSFHCHILLFVLMYTLQLKGPINKTAFNLFSVLAQDLDKFDHRRGRTISLAE